MSRPFGDEVRTINRRTYSIWRNHLQEEFPYSTINPILWFAKETRSSDIIVVGVETKRECIALLEERAREAS